MWAMRPSLSPSESGCSFHSPLRMSAGASNQALGRMMSGRPSPLMSPTPAPNSIFFVETTCLTRPGLPSFTPTSNQTVSRVCVRNDLGLALAFEVHQVAALEVVGRVDLRLGPIARLAQRVAVVVDALAEPIDADDAGPALALDVHGRVHEVVEVALALLVHLSLDRADLERLEVGGQVEEIAGDDVEFPVAVEVGHAERLAAEIADAVLDELDSIRAARPG